MKTPKALTSELNGNRCLFEIDRIIAAILLDQDSHNHVNRIWEGICTETNFVQLDTQRIEDWKSHHMFGGGVKLAKEGRRSVNIFGWTS